MIDHSGKKFCGLSYNRRVFQRVQYGCEIASASLPVGCTSFAITADTHEDIDIKEEGESTAQYDALSSGGIPFNFIAEGMGMAHA